MSFLDAIFGKHKAPPPVSPSVKAAEPAEPAAPAGPAPEVVAAISAGVVRAAIMAAVAATVVHVQTGSAPPAVHIKRISNTWVTAGRLGLMANRRF